MGEICLSRTRLTEVYSPRKKGGFSKEWRFWRLKCRRSLLKLCCKGSSLYSLPAITTSNTTFGCLRYCKVRKKTNLLNFGIQQILFVFHDWESIGFYQSWKWDLVFSLSYNFLQETSLPNMGIPLKPLWQVANVGSFASLFWDSAQIFGDVLGCWLEWLVIKCLVTVHCDICDCIRTLMEEIS